MQMNKNVIKLIERNEEKTVKFVTYADPPCCSVPSITNYKGQLKQIVMPEDWNLPKAIKQTIESPISYDVDLKRKIAKCTKADWNRKGGIIMLVETKLHNVFLIENNKVDLDFISLCSCTRYYPKIKDNIIYQKKVEPFGFISQNEGGCNPSSYNQFPGTNFFNRLIVNKHLAHKKNYEHVKHFQNRVRITAKDIKDHFPNESFENNEILKEIGYLLSLSPNLHMKFAYHNTAIDRIESIKDNGLIPGSKSTTDNKVLWKKTWFCDNFTSYKISNKNQVMLRFPWPKTYKYEGRPSKLDPEEWSTKETINSYNIEMQTEDGWKYL